MNPLGRAWYAVCQQVARVLFVTLFGIRAYHRERLPRGGGVLVVSNHQSFLDPPLMIPTPRPFSRRISRHGPCFLTSTEGNPMSLAPAVGRLSIASVFM